MGKIEFFKYRNRSIQELLRQYLDLTEKTNAAKEAFVGTPTNKRDDLFESFRKWMVLFVDRNRYMLEVINRFSPKIAKILKIQIDQYSDRQRELLSESHWNTPDYRLFPEEQLNKHIRTMLNNAMDSGEIHEKEVNMAFVVAIDTFQRVKGEFPMEPEELILKALSKHDAGLANIYKGAYEALESDNPDRFRHCSVSMRQIIDETFGENSEERKRVIEKAVRSKQESEILRSLEELVASIDRAWNKGVHAEIQAETAFLAIKATELAVSYLFR
jgi:hypothetical protein